MDLRGLAGRLRVRGRTELARRFGVDERALAALRVSLGVLLLADLLGRSRNLVAFYTDAGVLPRAVLREQFPVLARLSLHAVSGAAWVQAGLFLLAAVCAVALLLGYRTTLATAASFVLLVSLHARNPVVLNAGDSILRRLLFWGAFLPLGGRWSLDALRDRGETENRRNAESLAGAYRERPRPRRNRSRTRIVSVASAALLLQVVVIYVANAAFKLRGDSWLRGEAIRYAFSLDQLTVFLGDALAEYPRLLAFFDRVWLGLLVTAVGLVLLTGQRRAVFASLFVAMHAGMALTMRLGVFPFVSIAALLPFLPPAFWDEAEGRLTPRIRQVVNALPADCFDSVERALSAVSATVSKSSRPFSRRTRRLETAFHRLESTARRLRKSARRARPVVVAGCLALILVWNAATLGVVALPDGGAAPDPAEHRWDMFAPEPRATDGWYVVPGRLASGERRDAFHGSAVEWDRPPDLARTYPDVRWFKYLMDLRRPGYEDLRSHFGAYLCRRWNASHDTGLRRLTVYYVEQPTRLDGPEPTRRVELLRYSCSDGVLGT